MLSFTFKAETEARADKLVVAAAPRPVARAAVTACFAAGGIVARGRRVAKSEILPVGTEISVTALAEASDRAAHPEPGAPLAVAWESPDLLAINKPAGQPCHPLAPGETGTLAGAVLARFPETATVGSDPLQPGLVHRIDAGTSGLVIVARNQGAYDFVRAQFGAQTVRKTYLALVEGRVSAPGGASGYLAHSSSFRGRMRVVSPNGLPKGERPMFAETFWKPLSPGPGGSTLLEVEIRTGVTHQIRCHLASVGHPVVGDSVYGAPEPGLALPPCIAEAAKRGLAAHCLHSLSATFVLPSPESHPEITLRVPPPAWATV